MTIQEWLLDYLRSVGAVAGTVHQREGDGLRLCAASNIPEPVQAVVRWVPRGKGMAGLALESGEPVHTCNLKGDSSGQVRPGARAVNAGAAIALPVRDSQGAIAAVVGVAFTEEREIPQAEVSRLSNEAATLIPLLVPEAR
jgi:hypothetical protein